MSIFKCKMCGGALEIGGGETVVTCEYCGTQQTLPRLDDDRRVNLYDRANHFRRSNEFDKAMGIYEQILTEDGSDAEAYWSLVLCRYGIEYVEDPTTHKRIPTVNRAQFTSIFDDDNYKSALQYADASQRVIYEQEAKAINEIQKGILAISQQEEPFDVFICYKETDANGRRTPDSVLANDLYHQLAQEGFKVFFARITLEDKLGSAYEPYIFAALNSAKVMVVLGTKPEYFNAVWVKNEWSRYLSLIRQGQKKMLIPAYKDMDPYDLPEEFSHLQAQDMSKLGFMQDLIRGIKKIAQADEPKQTVVKETVVTGGAANAAPLLRRAMLFLEDGDWASADEYCEKVLDLDPENAQAYLGKLMAELQVRRQEDLRNCAEPFDGLNNYQKTIRFADEKLRNALQGYISYIKERNETARLNRLYSEALTLMQNAKDEAALKAAAKKFFDLDSFKDSQAQATKCLELAEAERKNEIYRQALTQMSGKSVECYEAAIEQFASIPDWRDAGSQIKACKKAIAEIEEQERLAEEERQEQIRLAQEKAAADAARAKKIARIVVPIVAIVIAFLVVLTKVIIPNGKYNDAIALMEAGEYDEAIAAFEALDGYKDSAEKIEECMLGIRDDAYDASIVLMDADEYKLAIEGFKLLADYFDYKDSREKIAECEIAALKNVAVGDYVYFGSYEQDNDTSNGEEVVEWLVLDIQDGRALLISKYALDCQPYNMKATDVTWQTCTLREWLNKDFLNVAFSAEEQAFIPTVTVSADKNPNYDTNPGSDTRDQVFLLSIPEAEEYFASDSARVCQPTDYAVANGAYVANNGNCRWWLRSPGNRQNDAALADIGGGVYNYGLNVHSRACAVRPAIWVEIGE